MRRLLVVLAVVAGAVAITAATKTTKVTKKVVKTTGPAARGAYLARVSGCEDCHTPMKFDPALGMPVHDETRAFSGHPENGPEPEGTLGAHDQALIGPTFTAFKLPFGTVYSANLTPDKDTGIGGWTEEQFVKTMRTGHQLGTGRAILPPMPWQDFAAMSDADLRAMYDYLRTVKPIRNAVPAPKVPPDVIQHIGETMDKAMGAGGG